MNIVETVWLAIFLIPILTVGLFYGVSEFRAWLAREREFKNRLLHDNVEIFKAAKGSQPCNSMPSPPNS